VCEKITLVGFLVDCARELGGEGRVRRRGRGAAAGVVHPFPCLAPWSSQRERKEIFPQYPLPREVGFIPIYVPFGVFKVPFRFHGVISKKWDG
jgi:hypothetical protein